MDQVKVFLRQCVKYRFWIAVGVSLLLPMIAYFLGSGPITAATTKAETEIKSADGEVKKYTSPGLTNAQYAPIIKAKTEILTKDVDATWQKLFAQQEPLLRWPEVVESRFRTWGRKWPENVDRGAVTQALIDYSIDYPAFVTKIYKSFDPWNPEEGTGIVAAPDEKMLIRPAPFDPASPPPLGKVWAEQERLWVLTALLNVVKNVNGNAKDWDGAIIKQINAVEVGSALAQDQVSIAEGVALEPAKELTPDGEAAPAADAAAEGGMAGMMPGMAGMMGGPAAGPSDTVMYVKTDSTQFTLLPVMMNVLVDQNHLQDFLVGLENSPITIQVLEPELSKPLKPVEKPVYGMNMSFGYGGMPGMMGMGGEGSGMMPGMMNSGMMGRGMSGMGMMPGMGGGRGMPGMDSGMGMMGMGMGGNAAPKAGKSIREIDKKAIREKAAKEAKAKPVVKAKALDPYYNVIEVTIYGQARFYNAPPPPKPETPSAGDTPPTADPTPSAIPTENSPTATPTPEPAPADASKPADAPKADAPKSDMPADAPKTETPPPGDAPKPADAPKADAPKPETPAAPQR